MLKEKIAGLHFYIFLKEGTFLKYNDKEVYFHNIDVSIYYTVDSVKLEASI